MCYELPLIRQQLKNKLPKKPKWAIVNGRIFYVCCPPCVDKLKKAPGEYAKKLDALYLASLQKAKATK